MNKIIDNTSHKIFQNNNGEIKKTKEMYLLDSSTIIVKYSSFKYTYCIFNNNIRFLFINKYV